MIKVKFVLFEKSPKKVSNYFFEDIGIKRNEANISPMAIGKDDCHMPTLRQTANIFFHRLSRRRTN